MFNLFWVSSSISIRLLTFKEEPNPEFWVGFRVIFLEGTSNSEEAIPVLETVPVVILRLTSFWNKLVGDRLCIKLVEVGNPEAEALVLLSWKLV